MAEKLTPKQKAFCDAYIENGGNATQAAAKAGYSEKTAYATGAENLRKPQIKTYIADRQKEIDSERICSIKEIQEFRTRIVRGEEKDQFELDVAATDKLKAANDLEKALRIKEAEEEKQRAAEAARNAGTYHMDLDIISDALHPMIRSIRNRKHKEYIARGGRASAKSTGFGCEGIEIIKNYPDVHILAVRKVAATLKDSVYAKFKWAIEKQGLQDEFRCLISPLEIIYKPTGQKIYFRGADDPLKIKSIAPEFGYIGAVWFEELDQFFGPDEIRNIEQSALRGGDLALKFKSYNPPKSANNWANKYVDEIKDEPTVFISHSTYLDVPEEWLGESFIEDAERLKRMNPEAYEHEYMGIPNGNGGSVFTYVEERTITDEEIATMDTIYQGVDWGWYPDPFAFIRAYYNRREETIYLIDEFGTNNESNQSTAQWIIDHGYNDYVIIADSAEKKSVSDFRDCGVTTRAAVKGPGSVEYGMKWLQVRKIVYDKARTPKAGKEIKEYEYARDKNGEVVSGYVDKNNHFIDALRYAFEPVSGRRGNSA